jgi:hypothetical protein
MKFTAWPPPYTPDKTYYRHVYCYAWIIFEDNVLLSNNILDGALYVGAHLDASVVACGLMAAPLFLLNESRTRQFSWSKPLVCRIAAGWLLDGLRFNGYATWPGIFYWSEDARTSGAWWLRYATTLNDWGNHTAKLCYRGGWW